MAYDAARADRAIRFINRLPHTKARWYGKPFHLREWQIDKIIKPIFGTVRADDPSQRQYNEVFIMIPRKNGKTALAAAIGLFMLVGDQEYTPEVYLCAKTEGQTRHLFNAAMVMIKKKPSLEERSTIRETEKEIVFHSERFGDGLLKCLPGEADQSWGPSASCVIYDEMHAVDDDKLYGSMKTAGGGRENPLLIGITTAGISRSSLAYGQYRKSQRIVSNPELNPHFLPVLFEIDQEDNWEAEAVWKKANPALGDFRSMTEMQAAYRDAKMSRSAEVLFRTYYLNQWGVGEGKAIDMAQWDACAGCPEDEAMSWRREAIERHRGQAVWAGLDLGQTRDMSALVMIGQNDDGSMDVIPWFWVPSDTARERQQHELAPYYQWIVEGWVRGTDGNTTDYDQLEGDIRSIVSQHKLSKLVIDYKFQGASTANHLMASGMDILAQGEGARYWTLPVRKLEELIASGAIRHGHNPVLRWHATNLEYRYDYNGNPRPSRKNKVDKIDGIVALLMALNGRETEPAAKESLLASGFSIWA